MKPVLAGKLAVTLLLTAVLTTLGVAQKEPSAPPKYDLATEATLKGSIDEVKEITSAKGPSLHLMVKSGTQVIEVYLCPNAFLQELQLNFTKGDEVTVVGSKVKVDDAEVMLAKEVTRGNETLTLRDKKGNPVWMPIKKGG